MKRTVEDHNYYLHLRLAVNFRAEVWVMKKNQALMMSVVEVKSLISAIEVAMR